MTNGQDAAVMDKIGLVLAVLILIVLFAVGIFDFAMIFTGQRESTVSEYIYRWSRQFPFVAFFAGLIAGHLFFRG